MGKIATYYIVCWVFMIAIMVPIAAVGEDVPYGINHQGVLKKDGIPLQSGTYDFRFSIIDEGLNILWSNDGSHVGESAAVVQPDKPVLLDVTSGNYTVNLGDTTIPNMTALDPEIFTNTTHTYLRIWFNKPEEALQLFSPDIQLVSVPYAMNAHQAETVKPGSVSTEQAGRSNQIKSIFFKDEVGDTNKLVYTVPADKTLILTDILVVSSVYGVRWGFRDRNSTNDQYLKFMIEVSSDSIYNHHIGFNAGIRLDGGTQLHVRREFFSSPLELVIVLSGYEF